KILHLLSGCPSILRLHDAYEDDDCVHIIIDLCDGGDLFDRLSAGARFYESVAAAVLTQLMAAIAYCHRLGVVLKVFGNDE
ncbi:calcium-dependent protein kinase 8, partial [Phtheirospermum japonicum]